MGPVGRCAQMRAVESVTFRKTLALNGITMVFRCHALSARRRGRRCRLDEVVVPAREECAVADEVRERGGDLAAVEASRELGVGVLPAAGIDVGLALHIRNTPR